MQKGIYISSETRTCTLMHLEHVHCCILKWQYNLYEKMDGIVKHRWLKIDYKGTKR